MCPRGHAAQSGSIFSLALPGIVEPVGIHVLEVQVGTHVYVHVPDIGGAGKVYVFMLSKATWRSKQTARSTSRNGQTVIAVRSTLEKQLGPSAESTANSYDS